MSELETDKSENHSSPGFSDDLSKAFDEIESQDPADPDDRLAPIEDAEVLEFEQGRPDDAPADQLGALPAEAPAHWSQDDKDAFAALSDDAKPLYLTKVKSLESGFNRKFEDLAEERRGLEPYRGFHDLFRPFEEDLAAAGITAEQYTRQLVATALQMRQSPEATLAHLAQSHGVDLGDLAARLSGATEQDDEFRDPDIATLKQQNKLLQDGLLGLASKFDQAQLSMEQAGEDSVQREWSVFAHSMDDQGNALYPQADELKVLVGEELTRNPPAAGETLTQAFDRAYDTVKWLNPDLRQSMLAAERARALSGSGDDARENRRRADVEKAQRAGRTLNSRSMPVDDVPSQTASWKEEVERQWDEASSAA